MQWYYIATDMTTNVAAGETTATLSITNAQPAQDGNQYFLVVNNAFGAVTSSIVTLSVVQGPPVIDVDITPPFQQVPAGVQVTYLVVVSGTQPFHYQWYLNSTTLIPGATNSSYTVAAPAGSNSYSVTITNSIGMANSATAALIDVTNPAPVVTFSGNGARRRRACTGKRRARLGRVCWLRDHTRRSSSASSDFCRPSVRAGRRRRCWYNG